MGNKGIYSMGKEFGKELIFLSKRKFRKYLVGWKPFSRSTHKMTGWNDSSASSHVLHKWPFREIISHELVVNCTDPSFNA